jgi:pyruvyl transferase EpsO
MERFGDRRIIQLPQSIHYGNSAGIVQTARAIERHGRFTLLVRDQASFDLAQQHFSCETMLCPDMAFGIGPLRPAPADIAVSALLRTDKERVIDGRPSGNDIFVDDWVREVRNKTRLIQLLGGVEGVLKGGLGGWRYGKFERIAQARLDRGAQQLARGRVVVTDRLHAHIISLLLGRPHAVLDNSYAKIERFMTAWDTDGALTHRSRSLDDALAWARRQAG